jgi:type II secretory pathway pseudopilin PulG
MTTPVQRGFTIIEAVVAVVLIGVTLPPMLWALRQEHRNRVRPVLASQAGFLAIEKLEDIIADRNSSTRGYAYLTGANYPAENPVPGFNGFSRNVSFSETGPDLVSAGTGYKKATVNVTWTDGTGTPRTTTLMTVVTDYTP